MVSYPSPQDYNEALQMPHLTLLDPQLAQGQVELDSLGLPFGRTGAFAITFKVSAQRHDFAFRCFLQNRPTIHERYDGISEFLGSRPLPFFVDYQYLDSGIRVNGNEFPCLQMSWANGVPLGVYLDKNHQDQGRMTALQQQIQGLALALEVAGVAHGDIQGGNLLIGSGGEIKLVDYDGMFVPSLEAFGALENGHPNFQHPMRAKVQPFDATLDRFSFALLHTVLGALIEDPSLWIRLKADPDKFLLGEADFANPYTSRGFLELEKLSRSGEFARALQAVASSALEAVPSFTDFLVGRNIPAGVRPTNQGSGSTAARRIGPEVPWYMTTSTLAEPEESRVGSLGHYLARNPVIQPQEVNVWTYRDEPVEIVGEVQDVESGESGRGLKFLKLWMNESEPRLSINIWAAGLDALEAAGVPINGTRQGTWISATGFIEGPLGSRLGNTYSITVAKAGQLEVLTPQQARWRLQTASLQKDETEPSPNPSSNSDAIATLTGSLSSTGSGVASHRSNVSTIATQTPKKSFFSSGLGLSLLIIGIIVTFALLVIAGAGGFSTSSSSGEDRVSDPSAASAFKIGDCVSDNVERQAIVDCDDIDAVFRVERYEPVGESCPTPKISWTPDVGGRGACLDRIKPNLSQIEVGDCVRSYSSIQTDCDAPESWEVVRVVDSTSLCADTNLVLPVADGTGQYLCAAKDPVIEYVTCVSGEFVDGPFEECFQKLGWEYEACSMDAEGVVLQQLINGQWESVKDDLASLDSTACEDPEYPWLISFTRKASSPGTKQYRLFFPGGYSDPLKIVVTEQ